MSKKTIPKGKVECDACNGTGECCYSCCTGDIITGDYLMCPKCHEHLGFDTCETCDGLGYTDEDADIPDKVDVGMRAELLMESKYDI